MSAVYYSEVNIFCIIILSVLLFSISKACTGIREKLYIRTIISTIALCAFDSMAGVLRGQMFAGARTLLWISNISYFLSGFALCLSWVSYGLYVLYGKVIRKVFKSMVIIIAIVSIFFIITPWTGLVFTLDENNIYHRGSFIWLHWMILFPSMAIPTILSFFKNKASNEEKKALSMFVIFPFISTLIQALVYGVSIAQAGVTIGFLLIYVMFQSKVINESLDKAKIMEEMSNTDVLTSIKNRRAYEIQLQNIENESWVGVIYLDLNNLKIINDTMGHKAGDNLIINFANLLREYFDENETFRVSGDEFVIVSIKKDNFDEKEKMLLEAIIDKASSGTATGEGKNVLNVIKKAEKGMYKSKKEYYERTGNERRRF